MHITKRLTKHSIRTSQGGQRVIEIATFYYFVCLALDAYLIDFMSA